MKLGIFAKYYSENKKFNLTPEINIYFQNPLGLLYSPQEVQNCLSKNIAEENALYFSKNRLTSAIL